MNIWKIEIRRDKDGIPIYDKVRSFPGNMGLTERTYQNDKGVYVVADAELYCFEKIEKGGLIEYSTRFYRVQEKYETTLGMIRYILTEFRRENG